MKEIYIRKMADNLREQKKEYEILLKHSEDKRRALVLAKMEELDAILTSEEEQIKKLGAFELERLEIQKNLALHLNIPVESLHWEGLSTIITGTEKENLEQATFELKKVIEKLSDVNSLNKKLLDQSLKLVKLSMNTIAGENEKTYNKTPAPQRKGGKFLDIKA